MNIPLLSKFPVTAIIIKKSGGQGGDIVSFDKARLNPDGYYELKKKHTKFEPPTYDFMLPTSKGKQVVFLFEYGRKTIKSIRPEADKEILEKYEEKCFQGKPMNFDELNEVTSHFKGPEEDMSLWASMARRQIEDKLSTKSMWDKLFPFLVMAMFFVLAIVLFYLFTNGVTQQVGSINSGLQAVAARLGGVVATPPPP